MKVTGFSFIRNAVEYDYPIKESLESLLPIVDEIIVAVGNSKDGTRDLVSKIHPTKIRIIDTEWDDSLREGGKVLAIETQKAYDGITGADWALYLQGDEVLHEKDYPAILAAAEKYADDKSVDGLLFKYQHFYGSYDFIGASRRWYRKEIRMVRPPGHGLGIYSYKDAQGFRKRGNKKLRVKEIDAHIYHYGWVKPPAAQMKKQKTFNKYWHDDGWMKENIPAVAEFDYSQVDALALFSGTHPSVMRQRIAAKNWKFDFDITRSHSLLREKISNFVERLTGYRPGEYKNYIRV